MGRGIAIACASAGLSVVWVKARAGATDAADAKVIAALKKLERKGQLEADETRGRITLSDQLHTLGSCDLVIESALEDFEVKVGLLRRIESVLTGGAILASNTSSLPLGQLADHLARPAQFLALHFFNPVHAMQLVELGVTLRTAPGVTESARAFCASIGKSAVEVSASPGYVVNRLLVPTLLHAVETLELGVATHHAIDDAMKLGCGHPMGPLALADLIGLDVVLSMATTLKRELGDARFRVPSTLRKLVVDGQLGRKSGRGFYDYRDRRDPQPNPASMPLRVACLYEAAE